MEETEVIESLVGGDAVHLPCHAEIYSQLLGDPSIDQKLAKVLDRLEHAITRLEKLSKAPVTPPVK